MSYKQEREANRRQRDDAWQFQQQAAGAGFNHADSVNVTSGLGDDEELSGSKINLRVNEDLKQPPFLAAYSSVAQQQQPNNGSSTQGYVWPAKKPNEGFADRAIKGSQALRDHRIKKRQQQSTRAQLNQSSDLAALMGGNTNESWAEQQQQPQQNDAFDANYSLHDDDNNDGMIDIVGDKSDQQRQRQQQQEMDAADKEYEVREKIRRTRESLPIFQSRQHLIDEIRRQNVFILQGETGCGKSTQLPQYLLEAGFATASGPGIIAVTQPRRVAAIGVARRVAEERGCPVGTEIGYAVRLEDESTEQTRVRFMTEGVLLRECMQDPFLWKYNVVVIDEAHERSVDTDVLLGVMRGILKKRPQGFKLVIMSATIQVERFQQFFARPLTSEPAPTVLIRGRTFAVEPVFAPRDVSDYVEEAVLQVVKAHVEGGSGGGDILVFMSGEEDVNAVCDLVRERVQEIEENVAHERKLRAEIAAGKARAKNTGADVVDDQNNNSTDPPASAAGAAAAAAPQYKRLDIIPCFSTILVNKAQLDRVLNPPADPASTRKCIVATNVAETSLTIDGVTTVIDAGIMKCKIFDPKTRVHQLLPFPISKAQAKQREGRAGRTQQGTCVKLYTERTFHDEMLEAPVPEIKRSSIDSVVLFVKSIGVDNVMEFPFIDPPPVVNVQKSLWSLWLLGLLDDAGKMTAKGRTAASLPVEPAMGAVLVTARDTGCLEGAVSVAAMLSVDTRALFTAPRDKQEQARDMIKATMVDSKSDHLTFRNILDRFCDVYQPGSSNSTNYNYEAASRWAREHFLSFQVLKTACATRDKLGEQARAIFQRASSSSSSAASGVAPPGDDAFSDMQFRDAREALRFSIVSGFFPQCALRVSNQQYRTVLAHTEASVPPNSALFNSTSPFVVFNELSMTIVQKDTKQKDGGFHQQHRPGSASAAAATKIKVRNVLSVVTAAEGQWLERVSRGLFFIQGGTSDPKVLAQQRLLTMQEQKQKQMNPFCAPASEQQTLQLAKAQIETQLQEVRAAQSRPLLPTPVAATIPQQQRQPPAAPVVAKKFVPRRQNQ